MYLVGAAHPNKETSRRILERLVAGRERLITDAEVMQEILHRYTTIDRRDAIEPCVEALLGLADEVADITLDDALRAAEMVRSPALCDLSARDAIHIAVMERMGVSRIVSFDRGFDRIDWLERIAF
jgi:predicted nucleic acid-binding protein